MQPLLPSTETFNSLFPDQPCILILPKEVLSHIFTIITNEEDLVSFRITCSALSKIKLLPDTQIRIFSFQVMGGIGNSFIQAVNEKPLNHMECRRLGIPEIEYRNSDQVVERKAKNLQMQTLINTLFQNFEAKCLTGRITDKELCFVARTIPKIIERKAMSHENRKFLLVKIEEVILCFKIRIIKARAETYACQSIERIGPCSFEAKMDELLSCFPDLKGIIKYSMREALRQKHFKEINALATAYSNPSPSNPKIEELKCALQAELEQSKTAPGMSVENLYEIETKLANLDATVQMEAEKLAQFYKEIKNMV